MFLTFVKFFLYHTLFLYKTPRISVYRLSTYFLSNLKSLSIIRLKTDPYLAYEEYKGLPGKL